MVISHSSLLWTNTSKPDGTDSYVTFLPLEDLWHSSFLFPSFPFFLAGHLDSEQTKEVKWGIQLNHDPFLTDKLSPCFPHYWMSYYSWAVKASHNVFPTSLKELSLKCKEKLLNKFSPLALQMGNTMEDHVRSSMDWDPKRGFNFSLGPYDSYHMITCMTSVNGKQFSSNYFLLRLGESF